MTLPSKTAFATEFHYSRRLPTSIKAIIHFVLKPPNIQKHSISFYVFYSIPKP